MSSPTTLEQILEIVQALQVLCEASKDDLRLLKDAVSDIVDLLDSNDTSSSCAPSDFEWEQDGDSSDEDMDEEKSARM